MVLVSAYYATLDTWGHVVHIFTIIDVVGFALNDTVASCATAGGGALTAPAVVLTSHRRRRHRLGTRRPVPTAAAAARPPPPPPSTALRPCEGVRLSIPRSSGRPRAAGARCDTIHDGDWRAICPFVLTTCGVGAGHSARRVPAYATTAVGPTGGCRSGAGGAGMGGRMPQWGNARQRLRYYWRSPRGWRRSPCPRWLCPCGGGLLPLLQGGRVGRRLQVALDAGGARAGLICWHNGWCSLRCCRSRG